MLSARAAARPSKSAKREAARAGFARRLRALDLLELVAKHHPDCASLLGALPSLVEAVRALMASGAAADAQV
jgi:hypothetical protein